MTVKVAERVKEKVERAKGAYEHGKESAMELTHSAAAKSKDLALSTDEWVHDNSWKLLGMTLAIGVVLGLILSGGSRKRTPERLPR